MFAKAVLTRSLINRAVVPALSRRVGCRAMSGFSYPAPRKLSEIVKLPLFEKQDTKGTAPCTGTKRDKKRVGSEDAMTLLLIPSLLCYRHRNDLDLTSQFSARPFGSGAAGRRVPDAHDQRQAKPDLRAAGVPDR